MNKSASIGLNSVVTASADQISCDLEGEAAILNLKSGVYYGLDEVGAAIWQMLAQPKMVGEIVDELLERYDVERERCQGDLLNLLADLNEKGLIQVENAPTS